MARKGLQAHAGAYAGQLERQVRAFNPFPGAAAVLDGVSIKIWQAVSVADGGHGAAPGTVVSAGPDGIVVACGEGALALHMLQKPGGKRVRAREFLQSTALPAQLT